MAAPATGSCPRCQSPVTWNDDFPERPFCSKRCKLLDLGAWLAEEHRLPGDETLAEPGSETPQG